MCSKPINYEIHLRIHFYCTFAFILLVKNNASVLCVSVAYLVLLLLNNYYNLSTFVRNTIHKKNWRWEARRAAYTKIC